MPARPADWTEPVGSARVLKVGLGLCSGWQSLRLGRDLKKCVGSGRASGRAKLEPIPREAAFARSSNGTESLYPPQSMEKPNPPHREAFIDPPLSFTEMKTSHSPLTRCGKKSENSYSNSDNHDKKRAIFSLWGLKFKIKKFCANSEHLYVLCESWVKKQVKLCRELIILLFWKFYFTPHSPPRDLKILPSPETPISQPSPQSTKFCHPHEMQTRALRVSKTAPNPGRGQTSPSTQTCGHLWS